MNQAVQDHWAENLNNVHQVTSLIYKGLDNKPHIPCQSNVRIQPPMPVSI